jgi:hypothetical protein
MKLTDDETTLLFTMCMIRLNNCDENEKQLLESIIKKIVGK